MVNRSPIVGVLSEHSSGDDVPGPRRVRADQPAGPATVNDRRNGNALAVLARLRPGITPDQALGAMTTVNRQIEAAYPEVNQDMGRPGRILPLTGGELAGSPEQLLIPAVSSRCSAWSC